MKHLVTIYKLLEKAERTGDAKVNGRIRDYPYVGPIRERYRIKIDGDIVQLWHWGTETLRLNKETKELLYYYGESNSDRDSMNNVMDYFDLGQYFSYRPVNGGFIYDGPMNPALEEALRADGRI